MDDKELTEHFSLYDLTQTSWPQFQEKNRDVNELQIAKLTQVAKLLEHVTFVLSAPLKVTSGYRCPDLNKAIGSTERSQHLLCEAADFVPQGMDLGEAFRMLWADIKDKKTNAGQLIYETAPRPGGFTSWIHISLGTPYRDEARCKQILRMENGKYTRLA